MKKKKYINLKNTLLTDYFDFNLDTVDLYENIIFEIEINKPTNEIPIINEEFYNNIPLNYINNTNKIVKDIKNLNHNSVNYDFVTQNNLIDKYSN